MQAPTIAYQPLPRNYFVQLNAINVNDHLEKKGGFSYLSWPYAVAQLRTADPTATWEVRRFNGLPYLATEAGVFVEVTVTVQGVCLSQIHPVLDGRNRPLLAPTAFDINTSIQRCLVKAIALHGLGLYIYAGEDLPQVITDAANDAQAAPTPETTPKAPRSRASRRVRQELPPPSKPGGITTTQQQQIQALAQESGIAIERVLAYFQVAALQDIPAEAFPRVMRSLEKRRAAA